MNQKFWLDPYYAQFTHTPIPLRFKTLYSESVLSHLFSVLIGLFVVSSSIISFFLFISVGYASNISIKTMGTVITCSYIPSQGKVSSSLKFVLEYYRTDNMPARGSATVAGDDVNGHNCNDFPIGTHLEIGYLNQTKSSSLIFIVDNRLTGPAYFWLILYGLFLLGIIIFGGYFLIGLNGIRKFVVKRREAALLKSRAELRDGEIISCKGKLIGKFRDQFNIEVIYQFVTPEDEKVIRKQKAIRNDLKDQVLPLPGTPITILYADKNSNCIL